MLPHPSGWTATWRFRQQGPLKGHTTSPQSVITQKTTTSIFITMKTCWQLKEFVKFLYGWQVHNLFSVGSWFLWPASRLESCSHVSSCCQVEWLCFTVRTIPCESSWLTSRDWHRKRWWNQCTEVLQYTPTEGTLIPLLRICGKK